ncbi:hypothetical protein CTEN210_17011 [Chaetoceros tenuissimus]|uniref:Uncharacterized protein n=1 Tax=Chaetoceros tenuissimus TaxID=426638 RepID=A0AAD3DCN1_9STRA|nr:hypothetical protein CTEN210_17011 [Chaetoceros tenuissimus]
MSDVEEQYDGGYDGGGYDGGNEYGNEYGNEFTETEHEGYFSSLGNSFAGVCFGLVMFIGAFPLLWWNEGRAVDFYQAVQEGRDNLVTVRSTSIDPFNEGKLVYLTGEARPTENLTDPDFGVDVFLKTKLERSISSYQWYENKRTEKKKTSTGGTTTTTTYSYNKRWVDYYVDSSQFRKNNGYDNPPWPFQDETFLSDVTVGAFDLPQDMVDSFPMDSTSDITFDVNEIPAATKTAYPNPAQTYGNDGFYFGTTSNAQVGHTIVKFKAASGGTVSVIAQQSGSTFVPWEATSGASISRIEFGIVSSDTMFENALAESKLLTKILRFVGALIMIIGIATILNPLAVASDIIPCVGECVGAAIGIVSFLLGGFLSLLVIGIAWVANRPVFLGVGVAGAAVIGYLIYVGVQKKRTRSREMKFNQEAPKDLELERD